jgi:hypothetical protein
MKFVTKKNVVLKGKIIPPGQTVNLDERAESTKALFDSGHISEEERKQPPTQPPSGTGQTQS